MSRKSVVLCFIAGILAMFAFSATASAYCGPGFSSKRSAVKYYEGVGRRFLPSIRRTLVRKGIIRSDEDALSFIKSDRVVYVRTPKGYHLKWNTLCEGADYQNFDGNLKHAKQGVLAVKFTGKSTKVGKPRTKTSKPRTLRSEEIQVPQPDGSILVYLETTTQSTTTVSQQYRQCTSFTPFMKDYCRNLAGGDKWKECKTFWKKKTKKSKKTSRRLIRTIPAPKNSERAPEERQPEQPRTPETPPKDSTRASETGDAPGGPGAGGDRGNETEGRICRDYDSREIRSGTPDVGGYCLPTTRV